MDQEPEKDEETPQEAPPKPVIPPPDLSRRPPPPPSPLDNLPKSSPPPAIPQGDAAARVNMRPPRDKDRGDAEETAGEPVASFNSRVVAAVIDLLVAVGVNIGLSWILPDFAEKLALLAGLAYFVTRDSLPFLGGQSVGKKAVKLKVTTLDGQSIVQNWPAALIRNGVLLIPFFFLIEMYLLLTRENGPDRGRRLGDEWAKTRVMIGEKPAAPEEAE